MVYLVFYFPFSKGEQGPTGIAGPEGTPGRDVSLTFFVQLGSNCTGMSKGWAFLIDKLIEEWA